MIRNAEQYDAAVKFYRENAGTSYNPATETYEQGAERGAKDLAAGEMLAGELGWEVEWSDDWSIGNHFKEYGEAYEDGEPETCETATLYSGQMVHLESLSCIDGATPEYRRVVEAELFDQAMSERKISPVTCGSCGRVFPDLYPAARCPFEYDHEETEDADEEERPTLIEEAERLLSYWEIHGNDPDVVAKWAISDMLGILRFIVEGEEN